MLKLIFNNEKKINKLGKKMKKKKETELFLIVVGMYILAKVSLNHEMEITKLKKVIGEMKSKGE